MNRLDLLEAFPIMLWTARADGVWTHVNPRWVAYTGLHGHTGGFGFEAALHPDDVAPTLARWTSALQSGTPYRAEYRLRRADGEYRWFLTHGVRTPHLGRDAAWAGSCTDIHDQKRAEHEAQLTRQTAVRALGLALEARDQETKGHTERVTALAVRLGVAAGLNEDALSTLRLGAYLHDIGKIAVPDAILLKPGRLTAEERLTMEQHVAYGERFATSLGFLSSDVLEVIRGHHERWDGSGYPHRLSGTEIPLLARIFALADVYDALLSDRPYKQGWSVEAARAEIRAQAGRQFDPDLTPLFLSVLQEEPLDLPTAADPLQFAAVSEHIRALALQEASVSVLITDAEQRLLYVNPAFSRISGYGPEEVLGRNPRFLQGPGTSPEARRALREGLTQGRPVHQLIMNYSRSGAPLWFDMDVTPIFIEGKLKYFVAIQTESSERVADHEQLQHSARHDALTGLLNRFSLNLTLSTPPERCALIFLDLDNLKGINDRYGHLAGDQVLRSVARTLLGHTPQGGQVFRLGGDEFLVLMPLDDEPEGLEARGLGYVQTLRQALKSVQTGDGELTVSVGTAYYPQESRDLWGLMGLADERMYQDKLGHPNRRASGQHVIRRTPGDEP